MSKRPNPKSQTVYEWATEHGLTADSAINELSAENERLRTTLREAREIIEALADYAEPSHLFNADIAMHEGVARARAWLAKYGEAGKGDE